MKKNSPQKWNFAGNNINKAAFGLPAVQNSIVLTAIKGKYQKPFRDGLFGFCNP